jgi:hypothetical protein
MMSEFVRGPGHLKRLCFALVLPCALAARGVAFTGTWSALAHNAPGSVDLMLLMSDGTVMAAKNDGGTIGNGWFRLTPDSHGSYVSGTWTTLASSIDTRLYYSSQVLTDGRVFVAGGEYGTGGSHAEVYDPIANTWTQIDPPATLWNPASNSFVDSNSEITPAGKVIVMPVSPHTSGAALLYDPATNTWTSGGHLAHGSYQDEASWVKLRDGSILTIDPFGTLSERYIPAANGWLGDTAVPVALYDPYGGELGPAFIIPSGNAIFFGATGHTAIYTPTGTMSPGFWIAGPDIPNGGGCPDAPGAMMVTGNILLATSPAPTSGNHFPAPVTYYEYDPVANAYTLLNAPPEVSGGGASFSTAMLALPDGSVLLSHFASQLWVYTPSGSPLAAGKPTITSLASNGDGSYHLVGTGFNGLSEGAAYGDDKQMSSNYPLVRLLDSSGDVFYARTYNWSTASVQTGSLVTTTELRPPANLPPGPYSLVVVANGFASDSITFPSVPGIASMCPGDASTELLCPCFNNGSSGHGCDNSAATGGALATGPGSSSLASDTVQLATTGELPTALSIVLQGDALIDPVLFGDGLRCAGGHLKRLYTKHAVGGSITVPQGGDLSISAQSAALGDTISSGGTRIYQVYYRDPSLSFCPAGFNATSGVAVTWGS